MRIEAPQGWQSYPFFGVLALKLIFSPESKAIFLEKFPKYSQMKIFQPDLAKHIHWFQDDGGVFSPIKYGEDSHFALLNYVFFAYSRLG